MEAAVGACKCSKNGKSFGIRFEKRQGNWVYNWAFKISETAIKHEGYGKTVMRGGAVPDSEYPGCPYCENQTFFVCSCGKLTCYDNRKRNVECKWCGAHGTISAYYGDLTATGNL